MSEIDGALERASFTYHAALKAMHHPSYTSPYVREQQVGLSSVLSLPSLSPSTAPPYVCVERERLLVVHTHLSLSLHTHFFLSFTFPKQRKQMNAEFFVSNGMEI